MLLDLAVKNQQFELQLQQFPSSNRVVVYLQAGKHEAIVKNVHDLLAKLAWDFSPEQLDRLFDCFKVSLTCIFFLILSQHTAFALDSGVITLQLNCSQNNILTSGLPLVQASWTNASKKQREKLLELIRRLAEDDKDGVMAHKVLNLLWNLAHSDDVPVDIMDQALSAHIKILDYSCSQVRVAEYV